MDKQCRVSVELAAEQRRYDAAEMKQADIDAMAKNIFEQAIGYRFGNGAADLSSLMDEVGVSDEERLEVFGEYLARLYAVRQPGVTDDRHIVAREYLEEYIMEWAQNAAERELSHE